MAGCSGEPQEAKDNACCERVICQQLARHVQALDWCLFFVGMGSSSIIAGEGSAWPQRRSDYVIFDSSFAGGIV
jgi:hypothetical protein